MINEIMPLAQLGGTVVTVSIFILYLMKKDKINKETYNSFNTMINNHLHSSGNVIKENSSALKKVAVNIKELSIFIKKINGKKN